jgi:hypothetical protein
MTLISNEGIGRAKAAVFALRLNLAVRGTIKGLDEDEKDVVISDTPGGPQQMAFVSEPGLYSLALRSRKKDVLAGRWHLTTIYNTTATTGANGGMFSPFWRHRRTRSNNIHWHH